MEGTKDQPSTEVKSNSSKSKLRYPLRSSSKLNRDDLPSRSPASKSGRAISNVSKSVSVLNLSCKEKSEKPPRRLSIPMKSAISPLPRQIGTITPISETRLKKSTNGKSLTPASDVSKSTSYRKFCVLSSASYWLSQIKLSESVAKHSVSLGFFKLALESGCEPVQKMRDELKSYVRRHSLVEHGESVKELLRSYDISETVEQLQVSDTVSQGPEEGTRSSDEVVHTSTSITSARKFKPKSLNSESFQGSSVAELAKKDNSQKKNPINKQRGSMKTDSTNLKSVTNIGQKKSQKLSKQDTEKDKTKVKNEGKNYSASDEDTVDTLDAEKNEQEDKENVDADQMEEVSLAEVI